MKYLCSSCASEIAESKNFFDYDGNHEHEYYDPAGRQTRILLFGEVPGGHLTGNMISDYTWFEGTTYRFVDCRSCGAQLGWVYYYGERRAFFALRKIALTEKSRSARADR